MGAISHQLGLSEEVTWATPVVPSRFVEFVSESLERRHNIAASEGIRANRRYGGAGRRISREDAGGSVTFEIATSGFGVFLEHLLGGVATVEDVAGTAYTHTFTPGTLLGKGLTLQKGVEKPDGSVQAFTYPGSKVISGDFSVDQDGLLMGTFQFDASQEETATSLASASYSTPRIFTYSEGTLSVDGTPKANVRSVGSVQVVNNLQVARFFLGNQGIKSEPINTPFDTISGTLDVEFQNLTDFYDLFAADTSAELELEFVGDTLSGAFDETFRITIADVRFEGETPKVGGPELVYQNIPFVGLDPATGDAIEIVYGTADATP